MVSVPWVTTTPATSGRASCALIRSASLNASPTDMSKLDTVAKSSISSSQIFASSGTCASRSSPRAEARVRPDFGSKREAIVPPVLIKRTLAAMPTARATCIQQQRIEPGAAGHQEVVAHPIPASGCRYPQRRLVEAELTFQLEPSLRCDQDRPRILRPPQPPARAQHPQQPDAERPRQM